MTEDQTTTDVEDRPAEEVLEAADEQVAEQEPVNVEASADEPADVEASDGEPADEDQPEAEQAAVPVEGEQTEVPVEGEVVIDDDTMRRALVAILMVTDEPLPVLTLARAVGRPTGDVSDALAALADEYTEQGRGFDLREVGGGWRYYTRPESAQYV